MTASTTTYLRELEDALGPIEKGTGLAIEIGGGLSPYAASLMAYGYEYINVDPNLAVCEDLTSKNLNVLPITLEEAILPKCSLMLLAHSLEHVIDLQFCLQKIKESLDGFLYIIVPYGIDDPYNPDHNWFFTEYSLRTCFQDFKIIKTHVARHHPRERFIYLKAKSK